MLTRQLPWTLFIFCATLSRHRNCHIFVETLNDNRSMLALSNALGFARRRIPDDPGVTEVSLK
jgi:hypothetical protein